MLENLIFDKTPKGINPRILLSVLNRTLKLRNNLVQYSTQHIIYWQNAEIYANLSFY